VHEVEFYKWLGGIVKEHRIKRKLSQDDLSLLLDLSRPSVWNEQTALECVSYGTLILHS
jgi:hypothetical protein